MQTPTPDAPNLPEALRVLRKARERAFQFGFGLLLCTFAGIYAALTFPAKGRLAPIYNDGWLRKRFEEAASPAEKDRAVYTLLDVVATTEHYYFVGALILTSVALMASLFFLWTYRSLSLIARHFADRA